MFMNQLQFRRAPLLVAVSCILALGVAGCSDASGDASDEPAQSTKSQSDVATVGETKAYDPSVEDAPCSVLTKELVAATFDIPSNEIEKAGSLSSTCAYERQGDGAILEASLSIDAFDTAEDASGRFYSITRGISADELSSAMTNITEEVESKTDPAVQGAAEEIVSGFASTGLSFEDVDGVGNAARFGVRFGSLYVLEGNLVLTLSVYSGPSMTMPETLSGGSMLDAISEWQQSTAPTRKLQSAELATAIIDVL